jgi:signal peptidase I
LIRRLLFLVCIAVGIALFIRTFLFDTISVASGSMEPTLDVGTHFLVNRWLYRLHDPAHGDIVVFTSPVDHETGFIKRVIAVGGDQVELRDKKVYLNGTLLEEPYTIYKRANENLAGDNLGPLTVPDGDVFVLGDNRDESFDSTTWTDSKTGQHIYFLAIKDIKGKLIQIP